MSWEKKRIGDCCEITSSKRIFLSEYVEKGIPFFRSKEIIELSKGENPSNLIFITKEKFEEIKHKFGVPNYGDLLLTSIGTIGIPYAVKKDDKFYFKDGNLTWFRNFSDKLLPKFLYYYLLSSEAQLILNNIAIGSSQKALTITILKEIQIPCPPIKIQQNIVTLLSAYDDLIENNNKQIRLLKEAAQRLYKEWFIDLRFPDHASTKIVDGVPEGWEKSRVCNVISIIRRGISPKYSENGTSFVINQKCIRSTIMDISNARRQEKKFIKEMNLRDEDIVICSTGAGTLGRVGKVFGEYKNTTFDSHITLIRASQDIGKEYLFHTIKSKQKYLQDSGKGSTNQLELKKSSIEDIAIFIPKKDIYDKFETIAYNIHKKITSLSLTINS